MANREEINARLKRTEIKSKGGSKQYVEVNQRILGFWEMFPTGAIITECLRDDGNRCDFKASVYVDNELRATGHAFEFQGNGFINKTSYKENCETSAIGRALGILGIGISESLASADEVASAISHQEHGEEPRKPDNRNAKRRLWTAIIQYCERHGLMEPQLFLEQQIQTRADYAEDAETLERIADELDSQ